MRAPPAPDPAVRRRLVHAAALLVLILGPALAASGADVTVTVQAKSSPGGTYKNYTTQLVTNLGGYTPRSIPVSIYGGRLDRQTNATGFFRAMQVAGRWWLVDPLGCLCVNRSVVCVERGVGPIQQAAYTTNFTSTADWVNQALSLLRTNGFVGTTVYSEDSNLRTSTNRVAYMLNWQFMSSYGASRTTPGNGHVTYPQNTIFAFDTNWPSYCDSLAQAQVAPLRNDPYLVGYFYDNELPLAPQAIFRYFRLDPTDAGYQAAQAFLVARHGAAATTNDLTTLDWQAFDALMMEKYLGTVTAAIRKYDTNHLSLGPRLYATTASVATVGKYADVVSYNTYGTWSPGSFVQGLFTSMGRPMMVSEFYTKGSDAGLANTCGAGWIVPTQSDRGKFYQNFCLDLLRSRVCVGWHWLKYQDNDPDDPNADLSNLNANKGIVDNSYHPYLPLTGFMKELNDQVYNLADLYEARIVPPTVSFVVPTNGQVFPSAATLSVEVDAASTNGTISFAQLFLNGVFVRQENLAPYQWDDGLDAAVLTNLASGAYSLRAIATDNGGNTAEQTITITVGGGSAPSGLAAAPSRGLARVSWSPSSGATYYNLRRSLASGGPYTVIASPATNSYTDTGLVNGTIYYYVVSTFINGGGESANSAPVAALPGAASLVWAGDGAANAWDAQSTSNWLDAATSQRSWFYAADAVRFDDTGDNTSAINLKGTLLPKSVMVNSTRNYTFGGSGKISGGIGLTKSGAGSLVLGNTGGNDFTGPVLVNGGTLTVGTTGVLPVTATLQLGDGNGAGSFNLSSFSQTVSNLIVGTMDGAWTNLVTIGAGQALTVSKGNLTVGADTTSSILNTTTLVASGGGSLVYTNAGGTVQVGGATNSSAFNPATLDLSGLGSFRTTASTFRIGDASGNMGLGGASTVLFATNTTVTATSFYVGASVHGSGTAHYLKLGSGVNTINASTLYVGYGTSGGSRSGGDLRFSTNAGSLTIRDAAGGTNGTMKVGGVGGSGSTASTPAGTVDLTGHAADIAVSSLSIGERTSAGGSGGATGAFSFDTGTLNATTIYLAIKGGAVTNMTPVSGTLNLGGGTVNVGSGGIIIASNSITGGNVVTGTLNLTGGTVKLGGDIVKGRASGGTATVTLDGGTLDLQGHNWGGTVAIDTNNFLSGTLKNVGQINNGASGLTKTGSGTLLLRGNNTYTGGTVVSAGTLGGDGSVSSAVTVSSAGTLQPGLGGGDTSTLTINNSLTLAGKAVFTLNRTNAQTASKVSGVSLLTLGGTLSVTNAGPALQAGDTFKLFNGTLSGAFAVTNLPALSFTNLYWDVSLLNSQGIIRVASTVAPRPTIQPPSVSGTNLVLKLQSAVGFNYVLEATPALVPASWTGIQTNAGGGLLSFTVPINPANRQQFFRFRVQ